jgi:hypothetical protein
MTAAKPLPVGLRTATWIAGGIALLGLIAAVTIDLLGRARLHEPDVDTWLDGNGPAIPSEPVAVALRD